MTVLNGTVKGGAIEFDQPLDLPENSRVRVTVEPVWDPVERTAAYEALKQLMQEQPIHTGLPRCTRDELYERD